MNPATTPLTNPHQQNQIGHFGLHLLTACRNLALCACAMLPAASIIAESADANHQLLGRVQLRSHAAWHVTSASPEEQIERTPQAAPAEKIPSLPPARSA